MESYPGELLVGVFPLVFCVDATLQKVAHQVGGGGGTATEADAETTTPSPPPPQQRSSSVSNRSQFDKFLDAMAASLMDDSDDHLQQQHQHHHHPLARSSGSGGGGGGSAASSFPGGVVPQRTRSIDSTERISEMTGSHQNHPLGGGGGGGGGDNNPLASLFRGDDDDDEDDSDAEDDAILGSSTPTTARNAADRSFDGNFNRGGGVGGRNRSSLPKINIPKLGGGGRNNGSATVGNNTTFDTSFAQALQQGQSFFQRARIVSISARHGFPPSKDPTGERNRIRAYFDAAPSGGHNNRSSSSSSQIRTSKLLAATQQRPIDGILPSGWLEKHAAALPSALLVVVQIHKDKNEQSDQDRILLDTLENLRHSLAPKRQVLIQVVGLVQEGVSQIMAEQWGQGMARKLEASSPSSTPRPVIGVGGTGGAHDPEPVILLPVTDLQPDAAYSPVMQHVHQRVRNASFEYYWNQCRDVKQKLCRLGPARRTPLLLPLSIRYCFKVAMFYEFQWKQEKSIRYMLEAYRLLETYYRYLLQQREVAQDNVVDNVGTGETYSSGQNGQGTESTLSHSTAISDDPSEGVELSISTTSNRRDVDDTNMLMFQTAPPADDMVYQCRAVADWTNFKILQGALVSNTEGGLLAASMQLQRHSQAFCSPRRSFIYTTSAPWLDWSYVAQQRLVVSQLLERYPARALGELGGDHDEVLLRCSAFRAYEAAADSFLWAGYFVEASKGMKPNELQLVAFASKGSKENIVRTRYVGGIDHDEGFAPALQEVFKTNHKEEALTLALRGLTLLEKEKQHISETDDKQQPWTRSFARLRYLAGGALLSMNRHSEAIPHLDEAIKICAGWSGLELCVRRMLVECYEKGAPSKSDGMTSSDKSMLLDSFFNAKIANAALRRALKKVSSLDGTDGGAALQWRRDCDDEGDPTLPFSFALTFPNTTHATAGDGVKASLWVRSNLDYPVHVDSVTLLSLAGDLSIPFSDLLSAKNTNEEGGDSITIMANTEVEISTEINLPKNVNDIVPDEAGNSGETKGAAGKESFSKSARPRTGGITAGAGARFVSEDKVFGGPKASRGHGQWSQQCLGGKPLSCDGIKLVFRPVNSDSPADGENSTTVELVIKKKEPKTEFQFKRTPFAEDNYIESAWKRPKNVPLNRGPRCLRVLPPTANMTVTNLTEKVTNGRTMEGTVNRILLKLTAGEHENCSDVKIRVKCSSVLFVPDGTTKSIAAVDDDNLLLDSAIDIKNPRVRVPVLMALKSSSKDAAPEFGFETPSGWSLIGKDGQGHEVYSLVTPTIKCGESTYTFFDVYRSTPSPKRVEGMGDGDSKDSDFDSSICETNVELSITYKQGQIETSSENGSSVVLDHTVSLRWSAPLTVQFCPAWKEAYPSGNRHPSNFVPDVAGGHLPGPQPEREMVLIDKERVTTRCTLEAAASADGLNVVIEAIRFIDTTDQNAPCHFELLSSHDEANEGVIYRGKSKDPSRKLGVGSKFSVAWTAKVNLERAYLKGSVTSTLGELLVHWQPLPIGVAEEVVLCDENLNPIQVHGPLPLPTASICRFLGPPCYIENSPFAAQTEQIPESIKLSEPFNVRYSITNKTPLDQQLDIRITSASAMGGNGKSSGFLVGGLMNGTMTLGPFESHTFSFTAVPTCVGQVALPQVSVASKRYKTWVIHESSAQRSVFVVP